MSNPNVYPSDVREQTIEHFAYILTYVLETTVTEGKSLSKVAACLHGLSETAAARGIYEAIIRSVDGAKSVYEDSTVQL